MVRFEATIHGAGSIELARFDVDRIPDPEGLVRALVDVDDCVRLLEQGFEVRLHHAFRVEPLDPGLILSDDEARASFGRRIGRAGRRGTS